MVEGEADAYEFGHHPQPVERDHAEHGKQAPEPAEAGQQQPGIAHAGHGAEAQHHLLVGVEHGDQEQQRPHQGTADAGALPFGDDGQ